jgi:omega-amidase
MQTISISLAQFQIILGNVQANLDTATEYIHRASMNGSQVILLPELWSSGYDLENSSLYCEKNLGLLDELSNTALKYKIQIGGSLLQKQGTRIYNTFYFIDCDGSVIPVYQKIHLFPLMMENRWLSSGNCLGYLEKNGAKIGTAVCYDLRFPELFRSYVLNGVPLVLLSAEWPLSRILHWTTLLKARAIENQVYIAAVNSVLKTGDEVFGGNSMIIDPLGEIIAQGDAESQALITGALDLEKVVDLRNNFPVLKDRRPDIYEL